MSPNMRMKHFYQRRIEAFWTGSFPVNSMFPGISAPGAIPACCTKYPPLPIFPDE